MAQSASTSIKLGTQSPDFNLPATDGNKYTLGSFSNSSGLVIIFTCNHCPYAKAAWPILIKLANMFQDNKISFIGINPNDEIQYPEDSFEVMKEKMSTWSINFPYLRDEDQSVAKDFGAVCTPDIFVFDSNQKLYYHGRINDTWPPVNKVDGKWETNEPDKNTKNELEDALNLLLDGKKAPNDQKPSIGCSIKWKE